MTDDVDALERCQRCGERGEDRRTLWMACFYAMEELPITFDVVVVPSGPASRRFYTLRVCKRCRGDWLAAIRDWFQTQPPAEPEVGVPIRELGATRMFNPEGTES